MRTTNGGRQLISWPAAFDIGWAKQPVGNGRCFTVKPVGNCRQALADGSPNQAVPSKPFGYYRDRTYIKANPN
ncbi:MAG TPA: hypothetical protein VFM05_11950 [Candidatus Saccharimonadales bacterium]|nr:hypothetical protein [Candidatus Saccharimonadales bacterium]